MEELSVKPTARLAFLLFNAIALTGCLATSLSQVDSDPDFNWSAIKRDQILMTPLQDLRRSPTAPDGHAEKLKFFSEKERLAYPEKFKQVFFKLRKDIRVFGAGGAFEHVANQPALNSIAKNVFEKTPVTHEQWLPLIAGAQDNRFVFFFAITDEKLYNSYSFSPPNETRPYAVKNYSSTRAMTAKLALWDSKNNKTVWIGTRIISPSASKTVDVQKKKKSSSSFMDFTGLDAYDASGSSDLATELRVHRSRFPDFEAREPSFSNSFDDFALGLPINPSEENLIEYEWFTYHRPELSLRWARIGTQAAPTLQLGSSSILNNRYRIGGAFLMPLASPKITFNEVKYEITYAHFGATFDLEWNLTPSTRLLTGAMLGASTFIVKEETESPPPTKSEDDQNDAAVKDDKSETDAAWFAWPRVMVLFGDRRGFQWGVGGTWRAYDTIEEPILKANRPSPWGVDASISYTFRGF